MIGCHTPSVLLARSFGMDAKLVIANRTHHKNLSRLSTLVENAYFSVLSLFGYQGSLTLCQIANHLFVSQTLVLK